MKKILVLHRENGDFKEIEWGELPGEWNIPIYHATKDFRAKNMQSISSTLGKETYYLQAKTIRGHLWWKKIYGHYAKEMDNRNIAELFNLWKRNKKAKSLSKILFRSMQE